MTIEQAREVLKIEAQGILSLADRIDDNFRKLVDLIYQSRGRVIVAGIGKSGIIGRKIVATLNSTGTRAIFLHPVEAMHGDLGIVSRDDIFIALSNSGETDELNILIPSIRATGCPVIAFTGNKNSTLARLGDIVIDVGVEAEACPLGLAPTASTTALLAVGDALAVVLINRRKFTPDDFKKFHPAGNLGKRLSYKVEDIMLIGESIPKVFHNADIDTALDVMNSKKLGVLLVVSGDETLMGIITDGDLRRMIISKVKIYEHKLESLIKLNPKTVKAKSALYEALNIMEIHQITVLPVVDDNGKVCGILHLHDILGKGTIHFNAAH
ncbi:MAG: KpsF/GutQ family sugar-phosphate isomerase [Desulfobacterales bacterium]|jgi:arabinose-5-phosphate isomerase|nr:KpsF/GutQ family sugar-phosphate isomerase [Desulfobacterales bacterium]